MRDGKVVPDASTAGQRNDAVHLQRATFLYADLEKAPGLHPAFVREIEAEDSLLGEIKRRFGGPVIANELMSMEDGERFIEAGYADALAFGRDYIATPDLAERLKQGLPLNTPNKDTFYGEGPEGYVDYPRLLPMR